MQSTHYAPSTRLQDLSDDELLARVTRVVATERRITAELIAHLAEVDRRRLYARAACSSMFTYCTERLGLSADAAQKRIQVARACRKFPELLARLAAGDIHLSGLNLLAPHLDPGNVAGLLARATGKSKRDIEILVAEIAPRPDAPSTVRKLPGPRRAEPTAPSAPSCPPPSPDTESAPVPAQAVAPPADLSALAQALVRPTAPTRSVIEPLAPARYKVQFTAGQELHDKIERARDLLRHRVPSGDLAEVFDRVLSLAIARLERDRFALTDRPHDAPRETDPDSRYIPADVKREVYRRDSGQCTYVDGHGHRCSACGMLEYDHVIPYALGGPSTVANLRLRCATHNRLEAEEKFGAGFIAQMRLFG